MKWLRLYTEILDDEKINSMSDSTYKIFTFLMLLCKKKESRGILEMSVDEISWRLRVPKLKLKKAINDLIKLEILSDKEPYYFINWQKRQFESDDINERVQRYRNKKCNVTSNVDETLHVTPPDTDTETDIYIPPPPPIPYAEIVGYLNEKTGKNFSPDSKETRAKIKARWGVNGTRRTVEDFKAVIDNKCKSWLHDPEMSVYLRPETLFGSKFESYLNEGMGKKSKWD